MWGATKTRYNALQNRCISIHAPRVGSDLCATVCWKITMYFNPRSPCGERLGQYRAGRRTNHFNPRSPCGERPKTVTTKKYQTKFQSTLPVWGATERGTYPSRQSRDFNPRSPCGERPYCIRILAGRNSISIHAPRVGSDPVRLKHPLRASPFQSTLPVWGATIL